MMTRAIVSYFLMRFSFFNSYAIHERKPWTWHLGGKNGGCEDKKREKIVSHQLGVLKGYIEVPINRYQCELVGIAMQRMH